MARHSISGAEHKEHSHSQHSRETSHTSSAFSASAQPDEDWTKITDLAERRRIQNRIAQRNYRKKLKKRMEDHEKKDSTSTSPEPGSDQSSAGSRKGSRQSKSPETGSPSLDCLTQSQISDDDIFKLDNTSTLMSPPTFTFPLSTDFASSFTPLPQSMPAFACPESSSYSTYYSTLTDNFDYFPSSYQDKLLQSRADSIFDHSAAPSLSSMSIPTTASSTTGLMMDSTVSSFDLLLEPPALCDMYDLSSAGSPKDLCGLPLTPTMIPLSPQFVSFEL